MGFVFYDTETTGTATDFDQILQFAAIATDSELQEVDRFEIRCRLEPHVIAHPGALTTNRIAVSQLLDLDLPSHYDMVCAIRERLASWSPAIFVGYNSISFDEHLLRQAFFKTLHPPYLTNRDGNCRADAMTLVQIASVFAPECLKIPCDESGKAIFKLDRMAPHNGFNHENAHDAMADVEATIHLARCVKERASECWNRFVRFSNKAAVTEFVEGEDGFVLTEFYWGKPYHFLLAHLARDPVQSNVIVCLELRNDLAWLNTLTPQQLITFASKSPKQLRRVRTNAAPLISALDEVPSAALHGLPIATIQERARQVRLDDALQGKLMHAFDAARAPSEESPYWEERLYGQFTSNEDEKKLEQFHLVEWPERVAIVESLSDERLRHFGRRLLHAHCREALPENICAELDKLIAARLLDPIAPAKKWTSIPAALKATEEMLAGADGANAELLQGYKNFLHQRQSELTATI